MRIFRFVINFVLCIFLFGTGFSFAANISVPDRGPQRARLKGVLIEGKIIKGDFEKFKELALSVPEGGVVWLSSPGGDLAESIKIGLLVRKLKLSVMAPTLKQEIWSIIINLKNQQNSICASACFFIYAAGVHRTGERLGVHRLHMTEGDLRSLTLDQVVMGLSSADEFAEAYLRKMGIPNSIIVKMQSTDPSAIAWLSDDDMKSLSGYIREYDEWLNAKCQFAGYDTSDKSACKDCSVEEKLNLSAYQSNNSRYECKKKLIEKEQNEARSRVVMELIEEMMKHCELPTSKNEPACFKGR